MRHAVLKTPTRTKFLALAAAVAAAAAVPLPAMAVPIIAAARAARGVHCPDDDRLHCRDHGQARSDVTTDGPFDGVGYFSVTGRRLCAHKSASPTSRPRKREGLCTDGGEGRRRLWGWGGGARAALGRHRHRSVGDSWFTNREERRSSRPSAFRERVGALSQLAAPASPSLANPYAGARAANPSSNRVPPASSH